MFLVAERRNGGFWLQNDPFQRGRFYNVIIVKRSLLGSHNNPHAESYFSFIKQVSSFERDTKVSSLKGIDTKLIKTEGLDILV